MKVILIIIGLIIYFAFGSTIAAVKEADKYEQTGKYELNIFYILFWPFYLLYILIKNLYKSLTNKLNKNSSR